MSGVSYVSDTTDENTDSEVVEKLQMVEKVLAE